MVAALALSLLFAGPISVAGGSIDRPQTVAVDETDPLSAAPDDVDPDQVRMDIALAADGSADWTVEFWVRLDDDETADAFDSIAADIEDDPEPYLTRFADRIDSTVAVASESTDREMSIDGFAVETDRQSLAREYGVIRYTFEWEGFAAVDGPELRAGDAIEGLYLDDGTRLLIGWPTEYTLTEASPEPDDRRANAVIWRGSETEFVSDEPRVVVSAEGTSGVSGVSFLPIAIGGALLGVLGVGIALWYRKRSTRSGTPPMGTESDGDRASDRASGQATVSEDGPQAGSDEVPEEFLSNEERVLRLLETQGGRMKQQDVVSELGWTDAKTSKVVSSLREDGKLDSFRLGRENVLSLPDRSEQPVDVGDGDE